MANHGFITTKKNLSEKKVLADLQEINQRRFKGLLKIESGGYSNKGSWFISYPSAEKTGFYGFNIWLTSQRKIEHRHVHNWGFYVELVFAEELGAKYNGTMSDEGFNDKWKPNPGKYPTYRAWLDIRHEHALKYYPAYAERFIKLDLKYVPKELKDC